MTMKEVLSWIPNLCYNSSDKYLKPKPKSKGKKKSRRYYIYSSKNRDSRIADKSPRSSTSKRVHKSLRYQLQAPPISYVANAASRQAKTNLQSFDTGSFNIGIDSHATRCISNDISHFQGPLIPMRQKSCKGFGGASTPIAGQGTIKWKLLDDNGIQHVLLIKKALFIPKATIVLTITTTRRQILTRRV